MHLDEVDNSRLKPGRLWISCGLVRTKNLTSHRAATSKVEIEDGKTELEMQIEWRSSLGPSGPGVEIELPWCSA
jgi:hypothetical protein